jgi:hypothetical protein
VVGRSSNPEVLVDATEARTAIEKVMVEHPNLSRFGFGSFKNRRPAKDDAKFVEDRAEMTRDSAIEEFRTAVAYLERVERTRKPNPRAGSSYGFKHSAEHWGC